MSRILVVEYNEPLIAPFVAQIEAEGYKVAVLAGEQFEPACDWPAGFDVAVVNWDAPKALALVLLFVRVTRSRLGNAALVIFVRHIANSSAERDMAVGVHEYIPEPPPLRDLIDRVKTLMSVARPRVVADCIVAGEIRLDRKSQIAFRGKRRLNLPAIPFRALDALMSDAGRVFTRRGLAQAIWGPGADVDERTIDVEIGRIRGALNRGREADPIRTVRGAGYAFDEQYGIGEKPPGSTNLKRRVVRRILPGS